EVLARDARVEELLEPDELVAVFENDLADRRAVDLAVGHDLGSEPLHERSADRLVLPQQAVDDVVARDRRRAVAGEGLQGLGLAGADAAGDPDGQRPPAGANRSR